MPERPQLSVRQMIEGMTLIYNSETAEERKGIIQFRVSNPDGQYYLQMVDGDCTFHLGTADQPSLTIITPAEVWLKISHGELSGQDALAQDLYKVEGDLNLLIDMGRIFDSEKAGDVKATPARRPGGPLRLSGMAWLQVAFIPWIVFWSFFGGGNTKVYVLIPLALSLGIFVYRLIYDKPTYFEKGTVLFFIAAGLLAIGGVKWFGHWGSILSSIYVGALWFSSLLLVKMPLCGEYSKWGFIDRLQRTTLFIHPNAVISLVWGWQFLTAAWIGLAALHWTEYGTPLTILRYALLIPAMIFTIVYQKGSPSRFLDDIDRSLAQTRIQAGVGLATAAAMIVLLFLWPLP